MATQALEANSNSEPRPFHALIIGIQDYPKAPTQWSKLKGSVADAAAMEAYLVNKLGVSKDYIHSLYNKDATRQAIIEGLEAIKSSTSIQKGDPILIYFAGHGISEATPRGWGPKESKIQLIAPYDYGPDVQGIPARTIGVLLDKIAKEMGDNITVILDCCFSGSATHGDTGVERSAEGNQPVSPHLDQNIWEEPLKDNRATIVPKDFLRKGLRSHVLLTACGAQETALEDCLKDDKGSPIEPERGVFTVALLKILEEVGASRITYTELIQRIGSLDGGKQNPQCEGYHRRRILFNDTTLGNSSVMHKLRRLNGDYVIDAGTIHGVTPGAVFAIYDHQINSPTKKPVAFLKAHEVEHSLTFLISASETLAEIGDPAFALQQAPAEDEALKIYIAREYLKNILQPFIENKGMAWIIAEDAATANLTLSMDKDGLLFTVNDERINIHGLDSVPFRITFHPAHPSKLELENIERILRAAARHHSHLWREKYVQALEENIEVTFTQLKLNPKDEDELIPDGPNLIKDSKIVLIADEDIDYGIKITNNTEFYVYPYVFCCGSDLSIEDCYHPAVPGKADSAISPKDSLTIGYGPRGGDPISFTLDHNPTEPDEEIDDGFIKIPQDLDVSFLKVFISTMPTDLLSIRQYCPFEKKGRMLTQEEPHGAELWHTFLIPLIQHRPKK